MDGTIERIQLMQKITNLCLDITNVSKENGSLENKLFKTQKNVNATMFAAGVRDARGVLDWVERAQHINSKAHGNGWRRVLRNQKELRKCLVKAVPLWVPADVGADDKSLPGILGAKIAELYGSLEPRVHVFSLFSPGFGLVIREGVPDAATSSALRCIANEFGVPWEDQEELGDRFHGLSLLHRALLLQ
ncbi:hypothetical protein HYH03_005696 [Edaphochlamys debaryana]|uniref:Uncharacterized protein n=1 Tax=Edaphochlamys debaryana TaxID=47281 RepID=A0A836C1Y3_9CHLO|nr:hypothetical protein HYH03_005696 [Edaphochlamys debaryana]|eukprot:KAG2496093.1 hypothetical protein HYH03_005696 [Edaphochlamys debaryana]